MTTGINIRKAGKVYIGFKDFSDHLPSVTVTASNETVDITTIADSTRKYGGGLSVGEMEFEFFDDFAYDGGTIPSGSVDQYLNPIDTITSGVPMREAVPISVSPEPSPTDGGIAYMLEANLFEQKKTWTIGDMAKVSISAKSAEEFLRGAFFIVDKPITSATNSAGVLLGSLSTTQKMYAFLHYTGGTTPTGITFTVKHAPTVGGSYVTTSMVTSSFTALSGTAGYQILVITASANITDTYWRIDWSFTSGTNVYVTASAGIR